MKSENVWNTGNSTFVWGSANVLASGMSDDKIFEGKRISVSHVLVWCLFWWLIDASF